MICYLTLVFKNSSIDKINLLNDLFSKSIINFSIDFYEKDPLLNEFIHFGPHFLVLTKNLEATEDEIVNETIKKMIHKLLNAGMSLNKIQ